MSFDTSYDLDLKSDHFLFLASKLNALDCKHDALWHVDIFSGAYRFDDEIPDETIFNGVNISLKLTTFMRFLWAYRMSLVVGKPRSKFAETWELTKSLAPNWPGFKTERCSSAMLPIVEQVRVKIIEFNQDIDRWEAQLEERKNRKRGSSPP